MRILSAAVIVLITGVALSAQAFLPLPRSPQEQPSTDVREPSLLGRVMPQQVVEGVVLRKGSGPLSGVQVRLLPRGKIEAGALKPFQRDATTTTDEKGRFRFELPLEVDWSSVEIMVRATMEGMRDAEQPIDGPGVYTLLMEARDRDRDGVADVEDNCPSIASADQSDIDDDGRGDVCDPDDDGDGVDDAQDNCPRHANAEQDDSDGDGVGDRCIDAPDQFVLRGTLTVDGRLASAPFVVVNEALDNRVSARSSETPDTEGNNFAVVLDPEHFPPERWATIVNADHALSLEDISFYLGEPGEYRKTVSFYTCMRNALLSGMVIDTAGAPIEGASVWARDRAGIGLHVKSDASGRFDVCTSRLFGGDESIFLEGTQEGFLHEVQEISWPREPGAEEPRLVLRRPGECPDDFRVTGCVVDAAHQPIAGARVHFERDQGWWTETVETDAAGVYRSCVAGIAAEGKPLLQVVQAEGYRPAVRLEDFADDRVPPDVEGKSCGELFAGGALPAGSVSLHRDASAMRPCPPGHLHIEGVVTTPSGVPLEGARVLARRAVPAAPGPASIRRPAGGTVPVGRLRRAWQSISRFFSATPKTQPLVEETVGPSLEATTDADGRYMLCDINDELQSGGEVLIEASYRDILSNHAEEEAPRVSLTGARTIHDVVFASFPFGEEKALLSGAVRNQAGEPVAGLPIILVKQIDRYTSANPDVYRFFAGVTNDEGLFHIAYDHSVENDYNTSVAGTYKLRTGLRTLDGRVFIGREKRLARNVIDAEYHQQYDMPIFLAAHRFLPAPGDPVNDHPLFETAALTALPPLGERLLAEIGVNIFLRKHGEAGIDLLAHPEALNGLFVGPLAAAVSALRDMPSAIMDRFEENWLFTFRDYSSFAAGSFSEQVRDGDRFIQVELMRGIDRTVVAHEICHGIQDFLLHGENGRTPHLAEIAPLERHLFTGRRALAERLLPEGASDEEIAATAEAIERRGFVSSHAGQDAWEDFADSCMWFFYRGPEFRQLIVDTKSVQEIQALPDRMTELALEVERDDQGEIVRVAVTPEVLPFALEGEDALEQRAALALLKKYLFLRDFLYGEQFLFKRSTVQWNR